MFALITYATRQSTQRRNPFRPKCRPSAAALRDWFRTGENGNTKGEPTPTQPAANSSRDHNAEPPAKWRSILTASLPSDNRNAHGRRNGTNGSGHNHPPRIDWSNFGPSPVEWVFMNKLFRKYPDAWHYIRREARLYAGEEPESDDDNTGGIDSSGSSSTGAHTSPEAPCEDFPPEPRQR